MNITIEIITLAIGFIAFLAAHTKFFISRQDVFIKNIRDEFTSEHDNVKMSIKMLHERVDNMNDIVVRKDDLDRIREDIKELKTDISGRLEQNFSMVQGMIKNIRTRENNNG